MQPATLERPANRTMPTAAAANLPTAAAANLPTAAAANRSNDTVVSPDEVRPELVLQDRVAARLRCPRSREQVARSLAQVVEDAFVGIAGHSLPHLQDALDEPIAAATEVAVETLVDELADLLDLLPEAELPSWDYGRLEAELGYE